MVLILNQYRTTYGEFLGSRTVHSYLFGWGADVSSEFRGLLPDLAVRMTNSSAALTRSLLVVSFVVC